MLRCIIVAYNTVQPYNAIKPFKSGLNGRKTWYWMIVIASIRAQEIPRYILRITNIYYWHITKQLDE
ncbi:hypothetical protein [Vagococcus fluvialis]|uniref:hypothetical protein n=1 Tax=Vagococcus fluvialis TaxID=2738 RepID=UPI0037A7BE47